MRTLLAIIVTLCITSVSAAADFDPFEGPKPLAIFIQSNPWAMVIGSDTPRVAIYENGDVIFVKKVNDRLAYHQVTLDTNELEKVREQLKPLLALKDLKPSYNIRPGVTDQPEAMFYFRDGNREVATSVYGLMPPGTKLPAFTEYLRTDNAIIPPDELLKLHKWLCEFDYANSKEWTPKYVEVMLWDYSYAPEASIQWPKDWPSLNSDRAFKRGDSYSIFLDGSLIPKLREFLATRKQKGAVKIDGKKLAVSTRFVFPGEPTWRKAFADAAARAEKQERYPSAAQQTGKVHLSSLNLKGEIVPFINIIIEGNGIKRELQSVGTGGEHENRGLVELPVGIYRVTSRNGNYFEFRRAPFRVRSGVVTRINVFPVRLVREQMLMSDGSDRYVLEPKPSYDLYDVPDGDAIKMLIRYDKKRRNGKYIDYVGSVLVPHNVADDRAVMVSYDALSIYADKVRFDPKDFTLSAEGDVIVEDGSQRINANKVTVRFNKGAPEIATN